jgi:hypothetical protein
VAARRIAETRSSEGSGGRPLMLLPRTVNKG